jgi:ABC-type transport system substrate-binding protein
MRRPAWAWLAFHSLILGHLGAEVRPRYGGALTIELSNSDGLADPRSWPTATAATALSIPIAETLVRIGSHHEIEPLLAVAWQHDADFKRWRFSLRPKVTFHDGEVLTASNAAPALLAALKEKHGDLSIQSGGQAIVMQSAQPMPTLLEELAAPGAAITRKSDGNPLIGTGPFRVTAWEAGRRLTLGAFEDYWGGRPYLDTVTIEFGSGRGRADLFDIPLGPARRIVPEGVTVWSSAPRSLVALIASPSDSALVQALALLIDRAPIVNVLAQRKGEPAFGLLPQWLSGYAFLFQSAADMARAKQVASQARLSVASLGYPANDPFLRSVAERVALNARDAGLTIQPTPNSNGTLRLVEIRLESADPAAELERIAKLVGAGDRASQIDPARPDTLYQAERSLLDDHRILPLAYLRETYGIAPRVHFQSTSSDSFSLHLEDAWLESKTQP